ncbi:HlyD family secretion protein [Streptomyces sp. NBC_00243]|uniref:HlyD family secretion protein n=1 Tax=Streptomyces sp. NBC_00243 TaxID=2975688 RepID=UPI002DDB8A44|nr:HlyD family secretion protein [Streptomyces sp. NBC_00243]WRZ22368.1 HlyD family secretion protein [Streptomyces sp. NBC_00243]
MRLRRHGLGRAAAAALFGVVGGVASWAVLGTAQQGASSVPVQEQRENRVEPAVVTARTADVSSVLTMEGSVAKESGRYVARATVAPAHLYRFIDAPSTARVKIVDGPEPFTCGGVLIGADPSDPAGDVLLTCSIPASVKVFPGLPLKVAVETGNAANAVTVPVSALSGTTGSAHVTVVDGQGVRERREVTVGVVSGVLAQVTHGLKAGEKVQDPVADAFVDGAEGAG